MPFSNHNALYQGVFFFLKGLRKTELNGSLKLETLTTTALFIGLQYLAIRNTGCTVKFLFHINKG